MKPSTSISQAKGFCASSSRRQNSGSMGRRRRTSQMSLALAPIVLFGTPVSRLIASPLRCGFWPGSKRKFTRPIA
jgi:hypothetical protein